MRKILFFAALALAFQACGNSTEDSTSEGTDQTTNATEVMLGTEPMDSMDLSEPRNFGGKIDAAGAISAMELTSKLADKDSLRIKLDGTINACCQAKGCWMTMPISDGQEMMVKFKDYGFFVPMNATGHHAVVDGWAYKELVSVADLQHYAEDAGDSPEEIAKITQPEERITFMADGVIVSQSN